MTSLKTLQLIAIFSSLISCASTTHDVAQVPTDSMVFPTNTPTPAPTQKDATIKASRAFAGLGELPPDDFAAYGIVAFRSKASMTRRDEYDRYLAICHGYYDAIPSAKILESRAVPLSQQMVTVWPIEDSAMANLLNGSALGGDDPCVSAISSIDLITSRIAIQSAMSATGNLNFHNRGPYLIAWSPSAMFGQDNVPVLVADLSNVTTVSQSVGIFSAWINDIEQDPQLWRNGWSLEKLRTTLRLWADRWGPGVLSMVGLQEN